MSFGSRLHREIRALLKSAHLFGVCGCFRLGSSAGVEVGLVDAIGEISSDMCKRFGRHVQLVNMEPEEPVDYGRLLRWLF